MLFSPLRLVMFAALLSASQGPNPDFGRILADFKAQRTAAFRSVPTDMPAFSAAYKDLYAALDAKRIDLVTATLPQVGALYDVGIFSGPKYADAVKDRLASWAKEPSLDGATAAALRVPVVASPKEDGTLAPDDVRNGLVDAFFAHPKLKDLLRSDRLPWAVEAMQMARGNVLKAHMPEVRAVAQAMKESRSLALAQEASTYWSAVKASTVQGKERQALRATISDFVGRVVASLGEEDAVDRRFLAAFREKVDSPEARGVLVGALAPRIDFLWSSAGAQKSLADLKGKVVVLDFWATWCGPCVGSMPRLRELQARYKGYDVAIVGVTSIQGRVVGLSKERPVIELPNRPEEEIALMPEYMKAKDVTWNVVFSKQSVYHPEFGIQGIPYMAILDAKGVVRYAGLHPDGLTLEEKSKMIDGLLKEAGLRTP